MAEHYQDPAPTPYPSGCGVWPIPKTEAQARTEIHEAIERVRRAGFRVLCESLLVVIGPDTGTGGG